MPRLTAERTLYRVSPMFDEEYQARQLEKMRLSICQDAADKMEEIDVATEEEFNLEVYRLVRAGMKTVGADFDRKQLRVQRETESEACVAEHKGIIGQLTARQDIASEVLADARARLVNIDSSDTVFRSVTRSLIVQALVKLLEDAVVIHVRRKDFCKVFDIIPQCQDSYRRLVGRNVEIEVDGDNFLDDSVCGGVIVCNKSGRVFVNNTLDQRLKSLSDISGAVIRIYLFGSNPNRHWFI